MAGSVVAGRVTRIGVGAGRTEGGRGNGGFVLQGCRLATDFEGIGCAADIVDMGQIADRSMTIGADGGSVEVLVMGAGQGAGIGSIGGRGRGRRLIVTGVAIEGGVGPETVGRTRLVAGGGAGAVAAVEADGGGKEGHAASRVTMVEAVPLVGRGIIGVAGGAGVASGAIAAVFRRGVVGNQGMAGMDPAGRRVAMAVVTGVAGPGDKGAGRFFVGFVTGKAVGPFVVRHPLVGLVVVRGEGSTRVGMAGGADVVAVGGIGFIIGVGAGDGSEDDRAAVKSAGRLDHEDIAAAVGVVAGGATLGAVRDDGGVAAGAGEAAIQPIVVATDAVEMAGRGGIVTGSASLVGGTITGDRVVAGRLVVAGGVGAVLGRGGLAPNHRQGTKVTGGTVDRGRIGKDRFGVDSGAADRGAMAAIAGPGDNFAGSTAINMPAGAAEGQTIVRVTAGAGHAGNGKMLVMGAGQTVAGSDGMTVAAIAGADIIPIGLDDIGRAVGMAVDGAGAGRRVEGRRGEGVKCAIDGDDAIDMDAAVAGRSRFQRRAVGRSQGMAGVAGDAQAGEGEMGIMDDTGAGGAGVVAGGAAGAAAGPGGNDLGRGTAGANAAAIAVAVDGGAGAVAGRGIGGRGQTAEGSLGGEGDILIAAVLMAGAKVIVTLAAGQFVVAGADIEKIGMLEMGGRRFVFRADDASRGFVVEAGIGIGSKAGRAADGVGAGGITMAGIAAAAGEGSAIMVMAAVTIGRSVAFGQGIMLGTEIVTALAITGAGGVHPVRSQGGVAEVNGNRTGAIGRIGGFGAVDDDGLVEHVVVGLITYGIEGMAAVTDVAAEGVDHRRAGMACVLMTSLADTVAGAGDSRVLAARAIVLEHKAVALGSTRQDAGAIRGRGIGIGKMGAVAGDASDPAIEQGDVTVSGGRIVGSGFVGEFLGRSGRMLEKIGGVGRSDRSAVVGHQGMGLKTVRGDFIHPAVTVETHGVADLFGGLGRIQRIKKPQALFPQGCAIGMGVVTARTGNTSGRSFAGKFRIDRSQSRDTRHDVIGRSPVVRRLLIRSYRRRIGPGEITRVAQSETARRGVSRPVIEQLWSGRAAVTGKTYSVAIQGRNRRPRFVAVGATEIVQISCLTVVAGTEQNQGHNQHHTRQRSSSHGVTPEYRYFV